MSLNSIIKKEDKITYDLSNLNILLAEDSAPMQTLISSMLRSFGVGDVLVCSGGNEAMNLLKVTQARRKAHDIKGIDIILTDWLMPDGSGVELIKWIRNHEDEEIKYLPIILTSGYTTQKVITTARDLGAHESLVKPISGIMLAHRILSVIDEPRPFYRTPTFFGPDRRRQDLPFEGQDRRKTEEDDIKVNHERHW